MSEAEEIVDNEIDEFDKEFEQQEADPIDEDFREDYDDDLLGMDSGMSSAPMEKHQDLLKELTNFDPFIKECANQWLGLKWSEDKKDFIPDPLIEPMMNEVGVRWSINFLKTYARGNNIITDISKESYKHLLDDIIDVIFRSIILKKKQYGITDNVIGLSICYQLYHAAQLVLMGAGDGRYNKMLGTTYSVNQSLRGDPPPNYPMYPQGMQLNQPQKKKGLFRKGMEFITGGGS